ncbi:MAG: hypothetical protein KZQ64_02695 [gamma proteobacterium symbiont of Bathyaustriella thionipta]|nr:hypothetical protein [gamma proteobacterium symbiont of Bathyaustriella thionipta]MCU7950879.1 hypothetical protein [gamma proteobacterium symbiont of Bathyaustriella thionipta]MCU7952297.1 hypothetical protein [gamma proteobacterium symbiont of Bathyaustriella thionipta]MCU7957377.1 hypothetical protein [gamma proteobacterium symbiont of Bathyaustriella thionipta]MCU7967775.1 hypothetical protein [gamma proteobacterium symbiont of Bathyaustriella thionipta]
MTQVQTDNAYSVDVLMQQARQLTANYRRATGKTLAGVSGEISVYDATRLLHLAAVPDQIGYDAIGTEQSGDLHHDKIQIKGRTIFSDSKNAHRIGQLKMEQDWDSVVLVLLNDDYEPFEIYEIDRATLTDNVIDKQSKKAKKGAMTVARFKKIATLAWSKEWLNAEEQAS